MVISTPEGRIRTRKVPPPFANTQPSSNAGPGDRGEFGASMRWRVGEERLTFFEYPPDQQYTQDATEVYDEGAMLLSEAYEDDQGFEDDWGEE